MGNKAFVNNNYEEALDYYTKAIEANDKEPAYYTNSKWLYKSFMKYTQKTVYKWFDELTNVIGAAVYLALERFEDSIAECDKALAINDKFVKAYFRKA